MEHTVTANFLHQDLNSSHCYKNTNGITLFDKNLCRINKNLEFVNEYYTPQHYELFENNLQTIENKSSEDTLEEPINQSVAFYDELYKLTMNQIESMRKTNVRKVLNKKACDWERQRRNHNYLLDTDSDKSKHLRRKDLIIDRNYSNELLHVDDVQLQTKLCEEQIKFDQKSRDVKCVLALKIIYSLLGDSKKLLSKNQVSNSSTEEIDRYNSLETAYNKFQNKLVNFSEHDFLTINQLTQNIQIFIEQLGKYRSETQIKNFTFEIDEKSESNNCNNTLKTECNNGNSDNNLNSFTFKINEIDEKNKSNNHNNTLNIESNDNKSDNNLNSFTFKVVEQPEQVNNEFFTFNFKVDKEAPSSSIEHFSFKIDNHVEQSTRSTCYKFEEEYTQFLENHLVLQKHLRNFEHLYSTFLNDSNYKSARQELTKSINTPVNSISSVSAWHMKDKYDKLDALLKCKTVKTGNSIISANCHKDALAFCKDTLAKKIINIGEQVTSVKTETAFEVASIVTELWQAHPDFGTILYARFKQKCPSLIPYTAAKTEEETDEEYYKSLGYNYTNGIVEKQDKYVKRMTGIIRLFAAIIVSETKSGKALGIAHAWMLIAATVNMVPQLDVTAVLIQEMLVITGYNLKQAYGKQFIKMLRFIESRYMNKIDEITPVGCGGPVQRLKTFLSKTIKSGYIEKPKGIISVNFW
ncbi:protein kinase 4-like [Adelges cooleyi]|uniref:protein kinase 4-like n=1 Tax=Adelges cooleyi TaxID=133065 RepID=UPI00217FA6B4|nr:protein kinase 4-like [Adelges cooleyi]XP_050443314.1 protein kinase 4-like [Adelges cooleyi]